ncbi:hypothetical protein LGZ99_21420 [Photorhabdus temperata]|uniref:Uncharacterized protein n=1 Tax=Photorhabdus temperata J3 TaxID=1389415 RepID=U7QWY5_PHOTE|nr:hypothetical protein [Photorhabdus temperata]ERT10991.1 hypothetical protein O185_21820 [Photorhabdus temperata J3]MCT8349689.1 hypothetical protein [Photorhabdus temperata]
MQFRGKKALSTTHNNPVRATLPGQVIDQSSDLFATTLFTGLDLQVQKDEQENKN